MIICKNAMVIFIPAVIEISNTETLTKEQLALLYDIQFLLQHSNDLSANQRKQMEAEMGRLINVRKYEKNKLREQSPDIQALLECKLKHCQIQELGVLENNIKNIKSVDVYSFEKCGTPCINKLISIQELLEKAKNTQLTKTLYTSIKEQFDDLTDTIMKTYSPQAKRSKINTNAQSNVKSPGNIQQQFLAYNTELEIMGNKHDECRKMFISAMLNDNSNRIWKQHEIKLAKVENENTLDEIQIGRDEQIRNLPLF
jgi:hypothetical protein